MTRSTVAGAALYASASIFMAAGLHPRGPIELISLCFGPTALLAGLRPSGVLWYAVLTALLCGSVALFHRSHYRGSAIGLGATVWLYGALLVFGSTI